jgi:tetratricopeptide (TPR) repeat protein
MSHYLRRNLQRLVFFVAVHLGVQLLVLGTALASNQADKQAQENAARRACLDGNYTEGVAILTRLFVEFKDVTYIFNQGRCLEQNRRYEDAIARFQEYIRAGRRTLDASAKAEAEERIADCKEMLAQEHRAPPPLASRPLVASPPRASSNPEPAAPSRPAAIVAATTPPSDGAGLRISGIVLAAVGVAAAGASVGLNLKANSMVSDMYKTQDGYKTESDRKNFETMAWIGYACVATGAVLYGVGLRAKSRSAGNIALVPIMGEGQAGTVLAGTF